MIGRPLLAALLAGLAWNAPAYAQDENPGWTCARERAVANGKLYIFNELSEDGTHAVYTIQYRGSAEGLETELFWIVRGTGPWHRTLDYAHFDLGLSRPAKGPIMARAYRDGVLISTQQIWSEKQLAEVDRASRIGGRLSFQAPAPVPHLHGAASLRAIANGPDGSELGRADFPLPDWKQADELVRGALLEVDRDALDYRNRCGKSGGAIEDVFPAAIRSVPRP